VPIHSPGAASTPPAVSFPRNIRHFVNLVYGLIESIGDLTRNWSIDSIRYNSGSQVGNVRKDNIAPLSLLADDSNRSDTRSYRAAR
jgi:hypothetical protein